MPFRLLAIPRTARQPNERSACGPPCTQRLLIRQGDVLTVEFTFSGIPCIGLNSGPAFEHNDFFPGSDRHHDQDETDRY
jgi:predicted 3-demethylubiquinone-9 3-methyltransferase (glyoxalase superfamily)